MLNIQRFLVAIMAVLLLSAASTAAAGNLFAIAADGKEASAPIAKLAGIAPFFHLYDGKGALVEVVANPFLDREFGIGPAAAGMLADKGAQVIVGRKVPGPKMMDVVTERKLRFVRRIGTVQDVADELKE